MVFNVLVDTVIGHWVTVVALTEAGAEGLGVSIHYLAAYFYTDDRLFVSTRSERLQREFGILT